MRIEKQRPGIIVAYLRATEKSYFFNLVRSGNADGEQAKKLFGFGITLTPRA